jgi:two-component system cell cycle sensor histidine kinase/response regulator CckA
MRVLVVDDERSSVEALTVLLRQDDFEVVSHDDAARALDALNGQSFDAIVSDLQMPGVSGFDIVRVARATQPRAVVVVLTGGDDEGAARTAGADVVLRKPADRDVLTATLKAWHGRLRGEPRVLWQLVENIREVFWMTNADRTRMLYVSPVYEEIFGRSRQSLYATPSSWLDAIHPADRDRVADAAAKQADGSYDEIYRIVRPDGSIRWLRDRSFVVRDKDGRIESFGGIGEDITRLKETEQQLLHAQKMEAVGRLAGGIAHDFNNMLSIVLSYTDLLASELEAGDPTRTDLEEIRTAAQRAADLTHRLLLFSRQEVREPRNLDLIGLLGGMEQMVRRIVGEDIVVTFALPRSLATVRADPGHLEQVVMNLVVNARDAMPGGGGLAITSDELLVGDDSAKGYSSLPPGPYVRISVADSGTGMDAATRARIFEPFFTTKERGKGTGLGLSSVFGIVEQSRGRVFVESELGRGTTFTILLPLVKGPADAGARPEDERALRGSETILLVEDDEAVRAVASRILRGIGYRVIEAASPAEALTVCEHREAIDLLLTDVVMPGMNGLELAAQAMLGGAVTKVLFMSGYADVPALRGADVSRLRFLRKPFTRISLSRKVREVFDERDDRDPQSCGPTVSPAAGTGA